MQQIYKRSHWSHFGIGVLRWICCIFSKSLSLRAPLNGCFCLLYTSDKIRKIQQGYLRHLHRSYIKNYLHKPRPNTQTKSIEISQNLVKQISFYRFNAQVLFLNKIDKKKLALFLPFCIIVVIILQLLQLQLMWSNTLALWKNIIIN